MYGDTAGNVYLETGYYDNPHYANSCAAGQGHYFTWAGDPNCKIPEGYPCACGQMKAHWDTSCGNRVLKLVPMELNVEMSSSDLKAVLQKI